MDGHDAAEDRGELTGIEKFRVVAARHEIFLESLQRKALREWERSRQTRHVKKTKTKVYPEGRKHGADEITEVQVPTCAEVMTTEVIHPRRICATRKT